MADAPVEPLRRPAELLLIEDNYGDVVLTREAFRGARIANNLVVVGDGEEALRLLRREGTFVDRSRPDLILLDLNLPRMDGREVLDAIKADPSLRRIPVLVLTGLKAEDAALDGAGLGADGYIAKPIDVDHLEQIVASLEALVATAPADEAALHV
jgi:two-component system, chemotaxis family, response regulator Rcp1